MPPNSIRITGARITPVAFVDPPLLNTVGVHQPYALRAIILDRFDMSLGAGLTKLAGRVFRIGHLGHFEDLSLVGTLGGVQMGLDHSGVPIHQDGLQAALQVLQQG